MNDTTAKGVNDMAKTQATPVTDDELEILEADEVTEAAEVIEETGFSAKQLATELGIEPKAFRRWLRNWTNDRANKGGRWFFSEERKAEVLEAYRKDHAPKGTDPTPSESE